MKHAGVLSKENICTGVLVLAGVDSGWYRARFWFSDEHRVDNRVAIAEQGLCRAKAFSAFPMAMLVRKLRVHGTLGGDTA